MKKLFLLIFICSIGLFPRHISAQTIQKIKVEGSTVLSAEIDSLIFPYNHQKIDEQKLQELTTAITKLYVDQGYITSGAFLPEQEIIDGMVTIRVVEGVLRKNVETKGLKRLKQGYINSQFEQVSKGVLNLNKLKQALESLQADPLIKNVQADLVPGIRSDTSVLSLNIEEASIWKTGLTINNRASPTIGEIRGIAVLSNQNLLGLRDRLFVQLDVTEGFFTYEFNYKIPLNYSGTAISAGYRNGDSETVEKPFARLGIRAEAETFTVEFSQEIVRTPTTKFVVGVLFDRRLSQTLIFDEEPFSFTEGPENGRSQLSVFRVKGDWLKRSRRSVISLRSQLSFGVDLFDVTKNDNAPDARFFSGLVQIQWATALDKEQRIVLAARGAGQFTPDSLLPFEQFSLGGATTVRGYRHNGLLGDNGVVGSCEVSFRLFDHEDWGRLRLIPFVDLGRVWNTDGNFAESLVSVGLGFDWQLRNFFFFRLDYAFPLSEVENFGDSIDDSRISFSLQFIK